MDSNPLEGTFSQTEQVMGVDAYQANVELVRSNARVNQALAERMDGIASLRSAAFSVVAVLMIPPYLIFMIWLFKVVVL